MRPRRCGCRHARPSSRSKTRRLPLPPACHAEGSPAHPPGNRMHASWGASLRIDLVLRLVRVNCSGDASTRVGSPRIDQIQNTASCVHNDVFTTPRHTVGGNLEHFRRFLRRIHRCVSCCMLSRLIATRISLPNSQTKARRRAGNGGQMRKQSPDQSLSFKTTLDQRLGVTLRFSGGASSPREEVNATHTPASAPTNEHANWKPAAFFFNVFTSSIFPSLSAQRTERRVAP